MKISHNILSKFINLCWATFIVIVGHGLDTPVWSSNISGGLWDVQQIVSVWPDEERKGIWMPC